MNAAADACNPEIVAGVPEGADALVLTRLTLEAAAKHPKPAPVLLHIARDDRRLDALETGLAFFAPKLRVVAFPAWDTVPYDRAGPHSEIVAKRITALARLGLGPPKEPTVVLTTVNAILQRVPPAEFIRRAMRQLAPGRRIDRNLLLQSLNLTDEQKAKVEDVKKEFAPKAAEIAKKRDAVFTEENKKARAEAEKAAKDAGKNPREVAQAVREAVKLTDEQKAKMAELRKEEGALMTQRMDKIKAILTAEQKEQLEKRIEEFKSKMGKKKAG